ncbi:hypothetical protein BGX28_005437 [Mortierella sp. GBA30]|nr:hypothetical protein BGX28_005437 [Mortierella sp. GBA30]
MTSEWDVHSCRGEADECIPWHYGDVAVATSESDFVYHGAGTFFSQDPKNRSKFIRLDIDDILFKLRMIPAMWRVAAMVSNNDYSEHVRGCEFSTNIGIIKSIRGSNMSENVLLASYCSKVAKSRGVPNLTPARFKHAAKHRSRPPLSVTPAAHIHFEPHLRQVVVDSGPRQQQVRNVQVPTESVVEAAQLSCMFETVDSQAVPQPTPEGDTPKPKRRPHQRFMGSNKFKITESQQPEIAAGAPGLFNIRQEKEKEAKKAQA